jgi:hypothetical protein
MYILAEQQTVSKPGKGPRLIQAMLQHQSECDERPAPSQPAAQDRQAEIRRRCEVVGRGPKPAGIAKRAYTERGYMGRRVRQNGR